MYKYKEIPQKIDDELYDAIESERRTYETFDKKNLLNTFIKNSSESDFFNKFKDYIIPSSELKTSKPKKEYKEEKIMKASSELKKKGSKYIVDTEMKVKEELDGKTKRALIKSLIIELNKNFNEYNFFYNKKN